MRRPLTTPDDAGRPLRCVERAWLGLETGAAYFSARRALRAGNLELAALRLRDGPLRSGARSASDGNVLTAAERRALGLRVSRAVVRALRPLPMDTRCLVRSLVVAGMLAQRGIAAEIVVGVRSEPGFGAHAWVECDGDPLLPPLTDRYERLVAV